MFSGSFSPADLFPQSDVRSRSISTSSLALCGPLPHSSMLHLALNHLRSPAPLSDLDEPPEEHQSQVPDLESRVLVLSPDRAGWRDALVAERDVTLFGADAEPGLLGLLDRVEFK